MSEYPIEIEHFHQTLSSLIGVTNVCSGMDGLDGIDVDALKLVEYGHLPIATLLRTGGGLENELLLQFEFSIDRSPESLVSLEFLSWFIRDSSRGGTKIQLRTFALPPETPTGRQLGQTLKFHIDYFTSAAYETFQPILDEIAKLDQSLKQFIALYKIPINNNPAS